MTSKTIKFSPLCGNPLEVTMERKDKRLFCKKHGMLLTAKILKEHNCLNKREYINSEGEVIQIICPHVYDLKAQQYYKEVYEKEHIFAKGEQETYAVSHKFKHKQEKGQLKVTETEDIFQKQAQNLRNLIRASGKSVWEI